MIDWRLVLSTVCVFTFVVVIGNAGVPRWQVIGSLPSGVSHHASVMMHDGAVLTVGGVLSNGSTTDQVALLDPQTGVTRPLPPLPQSRASFACIAIRQGAQSDVYVIGGFTGSTGAYASSNRVDRFRYDATTRSGQWRALGTLDIAVGDCRADYNGSGLIIVTGGRRQTTGALGTGNVENRSWSINIGSGSITRLGDLTLPHASHATLRFVDQLGSDQILSAGGEQPSSTTVTELLISTTWDARTNSPRQWRAKGTSTTDRADIARVFAGLDVNNLPSANCEWFDPKLGWRAAPRMNVARHSHALTRVEGPTDSADAILNLAGRTSTTTTASAELFVLPGGTDPNGAWESMPDLVLPISETSTAMSAWNLPVVNGGANAQGITSIVQMFQPLQANDVAMPSTEVSALSDSVILDVTNTWMLPVHLDRVVVDGTAEFLLVGFSNAGETILAGQTKRFFVYFRPAVEGTRNAKVRLHIGPVTDTVNITGIGLRSTVSLTTTGVDMGEVIVSTQRDTCLPLVVNQGTDTLRIDSMIIDDADVSIISPLGRAKVAPGETLMVCIRYRPSARRVLGATMSIHIGARSLPVAVIGRGVRRYVVVQSDIECDTISAKPGDDVTVVAQILNPSDRIVRITAINVTSTNAGTVTLDPSMTFPIDVAPNASVPVVLVQRIVRESREDIVITTVDDGDTLARGTICTVPRSRTLQLSHSVIDLGVICGGQIVNRTLRIDNVSSIESIQIDAVNISGLVGSTTLTTPLTLPPRQSVDVDVTLTIPLNGMIDGRISFDGPNGSTVAIVTGTIAPTVDVRADDATMITGFVGSHALRATTQTPQTVNMQLLYQPRLLSPRAVLSSAVPLTSQTGNIITPGVYEITLTMSRAPADGEAIAQIEYDVLRADAVQTSIVTGPTATEPCVVADTAAITIDPFCGSSAGFVYLSSQPTMITQQMMDGTLVVHLINVKESGTLTINNVLGEHLGTRNLELGTLTLSGHAWNMERGTWNPSLFMLTFVGSEGTVVRTIHHQR